MQRLNNMKLTTGQKRNRRNDQKILKTNENDKTTYQNFWDTASSNKREVCSITGLT